MTVLLPTFVDKVCIAATSSGTGTFALGNALPAFRGVEALVNGHTYSYSVQQDNNLEYGRGVYNSGARTLTRTVFISSYGAGVPVPFNVGAAVTFTLLAEDLYDLIASLMAPPADKYTLQWAPWFNGTPVADELMALYCAPTDYQYLTDFAGCATAPPLVNPTQDFIMRIELQTGGLGSWDLIGQIGISFVDGAVSIATTSGMPLPIFAGDRLRVLAPHVPDDTISGFAITLKGFAA